MFFSKKRLFILLLPVFFIVLSAVPKTAFATCGFVLNNKCSDLGKEWVKVDPRVCAASPIQGKTKKCCCDNKEDGCCIVQVRTKPINPIETRIRTTNIRDCKMTMLMVSKPKFFYGKRASNEADPTKRHCVDHYRSNGLASPSNPASSGGSPPVASNSPAGSGGSGGSAPVVSNSPTTTFSGTISTVSNPIGTNSIPELIGRIIKAMLGVVGSLALVMFVAGGLMWMTSAGNEKRVAAGKNTLIWAAIGLTVVFFSYILVRFVLEAVGA